MPPDRATCTVKMARRRFPGAPANLDALCRRFGVDNSGRALHGALLDAQLLAECYVELLGGMSVSGGIQVRVNGRRMTAAADAVTGAGSTNNKVKIDLGATLQRAHIEVLFHSAWSLSKIFVDANGTVSRTC